MDEFEKEKLDSLKRMMGSIRCLIDKEVESELLRLKEEIENKIEEKYHWSKLNKSLDELEICWQKKATLSEILIYKGIKPNS